MCDCVCVACEARGSAAPRRENASIVATGEINRVSSGSARRMTTTTTMRRVLALAPRASSAAFGDARARACAYATTTTARTTSATTTTEKEDATTVGASSDARASASAAAASAAMGRKASFGYTEVEYTEKEKLVRGVFERVAPSYDVMNDLMSAGVHRLWKDYFVSKVGAFAGMTHLDVAGGTGDIAFRVLRALQKAEKNAELDGQVLDGKTRGRVIVSDINPAMLREGIKRATQRGLSQSQLEWLEGNAEKLPIEDNSIDVYTIAFGLRNVTNTSAALADAHRCLKPGGKYMILEFSHVESEPLKSVYDFYSFNVIPKLGEIVARDRDSYQYLVESIRKFPTQEKLKTMMRDVGFKHVTHENLTGGMVAIHTGYKE